VQLKLRALDRHPNAAVTTLSLSENCEGVTE
jgi:hypothetical protein